MDDDALIGAMLEAFASPRGFEPMYRDRMRAALAVAAPELRRRALEEARWLVSEARFFRDKAHVSPEWEARARAFLAEPPTSGQGGTCGVCNGAGEPKPPVLDEKALEAARKAVEDVLLDFRDSRISVFCGNGFVVREGDGAESHVIRLSTRDGLAIGIAVYLKARGERP